MSRTPKHAVILCHPKRDSFNGAVADAYCAAVRDIGHEVCLRDLYRIGFDPVLKDIERRGDPGFQSLPDVAEEVRLISGASVFVLISPIERKSTRRNQVTYTHRVCRLLLYNNIPII